MDVRVGLWIKLSTQELMLLNCGVGEDSWESLRLQGDPTSPFWRRSVLGVHWKNWCWSWNSNTLATWCKELTHWKRPWCWEGLRAGGEGDDREWDGRMASPTRWMWVWVNSGSWWWTGRPVVLQFMGSQTEQLNWTDIYVHFLLIFPFYRPCVCSVAQSCPTFCSSIDCSPPGFSVCGIFQARILGRIVLSFSRGFSWPRVEPISLASPASAGKFFTTVLPGKPL